jgi:hypothetical protein
MDEIHQVDFAYWARMPKWEPEEAAALLLVLDPAFMAGEPEYYCGPRAEGYQKLYYLTQRAFIAGQIDRPYGPAQWIAWAKKLDFPIRPELEKQVTRFWPDKQSAASARIRDKTACKKELVAMMEAEPQNPLPKDEVYSNHFAHLPKRMFDNAWAAAVEEAGTPKWSAPGRRRKAGA